ncbi:HNH endonuclease [Streptomyces phage Beuffert]|nr:HNH endonuclease [Streptomyces phage Beuffert]
MKLMSFEFSAEYKTYIKSQRWKRVCTRYWAAYGRKCQACGKRRDLHVHHHTYARFGRELLTDLTGLCHDCHRRVHQRHRANRRVSLELVTKQYVKNYQAKKL